MQRYILRRLLFLVFVIVGTITLLFTIMYLIPADPAKAAAGLNARPEQVESIRRELGLDKPVHIQYLTYIRNLLRGNLGISVLTRKPVMSELRVYLPASLELVLAALLLNVVIAVPLGVFSALRPGHVADTLSRLFAALGVGMPVFWVGLVGQLLFYGKLNWLPYGGRLSTGLLPPPYVTGFYTVDALLAGDFGLFGDALTHLILPSAVLALPQLAVISRLTRSSMLDVLAQDYIRTARAKGLLPSRVVWVHALKNAFLVPLTMLGMQIGWMLGGTLLVESVFSWGGLGFFAFNGIKQHDFPVVMGVTLVVCIAFVFSNLIVDILYAYLDPRITYSA
ncbi:MAG: ABC transporter permease [Anaerolineae bacterium]